MRDEAPTPEGSESSGFKSHRSLSGLDSSSDKVQGFMLIAVWAGTFILAWMVILGIFGGFLYLVNLVFGG